MVRRDGSAIPDPGVQVDVYEGTMREELTLRATHRVDAWGTDINGHKPNVYQVDRDTLIEHFADFALEIRDEAVRERDAEWREAIEEVKAEGDDRAVRLHPFYVRDEKNYESYIITRHSIRSANTALDDLKAKMENKR
jgi:hypothetical protein